MKEKFVQPLLIALVMLLAVQLTGLSCLSDFAVNPGPPVLLAQDGVHHHLNGFATTADDGCPCHLMFQTVTPFHLSVVSPFTSMLPEAPPLFVLTLIHFLFHPPALT